MFEDNAQQYLGVSFFAIRLASTIRHQQAREEIAAAEDAIARGAFEEALGLLRAAFEMVVGPTIRARTVDRLVSRALENHANKAGLSLEVRRINQTVEQFSRRFAVVECGINVATYDRFLAVTPPVYLPSDPRRRQISKLSWGALVSTRENASFALSFVLETIQRIEGTANPRNHHSLYRVRAKTDTPCTIWRDGTLVEVATIPAGEVVPDVHFASAPFGPVWSWEREGEHVMVPLDSCDIVSETTREEQVQQVKDEAIRRYNAEHKDVP